MVAEIDNELIKVELMLPSADKGAAYYKLTAYDKAIQTFRGLNNINANPSALFYLGRSHEESGNNGQAAENYRRIIALHAKTDWAVKANRRLFAMGAFYTAGQEYRQESKSNVEKKVVIDPGLINESKRYEKVALHIENLESQKAKDTHQAATSAPVPVAAAPDEKKPAPVRALPAIPVKKEIARTIAPPPVRPDEPAVTIAKADPVVPKTVAEPTPPIPVTAPAAKEPSAIELAKTWEQKETLSRKDKSAYLRSQKILHRVTMEDGNQFTGVLIRETPAEIFLFTVMGKIVVDKSQVAERVKIRQ
jgi:tetratricopeptide (TPR) repeat protein